jgi:hypothetical protein
MEKDRPLQAKYPETCGTFREDEHENVGGTG